MSRLLVFMTLLLTLSLTNIQAHAQSDALSDGIDPLQSLFGLIGGSPQGGLNNVSGVSAPSIAIGSGATSNANSLSGFLSSLFNPTSSTLNLSGLSSGQKSLAGLFESLFGALPGSLPSGASSLSQGVTLQSLNMAQSFSSSVQNILAPMTSGQDGAGLQTSTQNNLSATQPITALQGVASSLNTTTNNGLTLSLSGFNFNFGQ
jgi:hypothetical protein